jgi:tetratricopeptide (TPR) repeat protein
MLFHDTVTALLTVSAHLARRQTPVDKEKTLKRAASNPDAPNYQLQSNYELHEFYWETARRLESEEKFSEAIAMWQKSRDLCHGVSEAIKAHPDTRLQLSTTLSGLAATQILAGQLEDAVASYSERVEVVKSLLDVSPYSGRDLCYTYFWRGKIQGELGRQEPLRPGNRPSRHLTLCRQSSESLPSGYLVARRFIISAAIRKRGKALSW